MKVYISVDIEGITGVSAWPETELDNPQHQEAREQMTREALAACEGALEMGASEIYIKDAHDSGRNLDLTKFPKEVKVIRGWTGDPTSMLGGLDESFDAVIFIGYHAAAGEDGNPLAHTINSDLLNYIKVNGQLASEFMLNSYTATEIGVPCVFLSGDKMLCENAREIAPNIETLAVKEGRGGATIDISKKLACELIREGVKKGLRKIDQCRIDLPEKFQVEMSYKDHRHVDRAKHYPGVEKLDAHRVGFTKPSVYEFMVTRMFLMA